MNAEQGFWSAVDQLVAESTIVVDRPKGTSHPRNSEIIYPLDYGYLAGTTSGDGHGIDVWIGSQGESSVNGVICTVDLGKRDMEVKILLGCSEDEIQIIERFHSSGFMRCTVLKKEY